MTETTLAERVSYAKKRTTKQLKHDVVGWCNRALWAIEEIKASVMVLNGRRAARKPGKRGG